MNYFLLTEHKTGLDTIFNAYRDSSYQRDNFSSLAGFSSEAEFESSLNGAIDRWCAAPHAASVQTQEEFQHFDRGDRVVNQELVSPSSPILPRP